MFLGVLDIPIVLSMLKGNISSSDYTFHATGVFL